jgi:hypothetical protein
MMPTRKPATGAGNVGNKPQRKKRHRPRKGAHKLEPANSILVGR